MCRYSSDISKSVGAADVVLFRQVPIHKLTLRKKIMAAKKKNNSDSFGDAKYAHTYTKNSMKANSPSASTRDKTVHDRIAKMQKQNMAKSEAKKKTAPKKK